MYSLSLNFSAYDNFWVYVYAQSYLTTGKLYLSCDVDTSLYFNYSSKTSYRSEEPEQEANSLNELDNNPGGISNDKSEKQCNGIDKLISGPLIDLCIETNTQSRCIADVNLYFVRIKKREHRPVPSNIRMGSNTFERFSEMISSYSDGVYDHTVLSLFEELFSHRTLILWNNTEETFYKMYSCLNNHQMMDLEVKTMYGNESYTAMKSNLSLFLTAIQHLYSNLNLASAVRIFLLKINPLSDYCQIFRDEGRFERFICNPVNQHTLCILVINEIVLKTAVISPEFVLQPKTLFDAIFLHILMYHTIEKPFPPSRLAEFTFMEQCITGYLDTHEPNDWTAELLTALSETSTINSSSACFRLQDGTNENSEINF
ncbi:unnamed protein product [Allacma fusca]|uniref:Uncharacterized protein n=1 Tax=Allacma fusca TaxID=39272 RepID=A0A8J2NVE1_9HEXA|nr:unnamed protein product [Allacma fusca]